MNTQRRWHHMTFLSKKETGRRKGMMGKEQYQGYI
jgi:hypothetical protein